MGLAPVEDRTSLGGVYSASHDAAVHARSRARAVLSWIPVLMVFAFVLELTCRVEDWVTYRTPALSSATSISDLVVRDADGMHGRPNSRYQKWVMNSLGVRGPETTVIPAAGTVRVITVGASETFGLRESPHHEYPRQLEDSLNARIARSSCSAGVKPHFEVLNAGFAGMALPTIEQDVRLRLHRYQPAIIVVYPTPAQYLDDELPFPAVPDSSAPKPPSVLKPLYPRVAGRIRDQLKLLLPNFVQAQMRRYQTRWLLRSKPPGWQITTLPGDRLALYDRQLRSLIGTIRAEGATPVLATHGNMFMGRPKMDSLALISWEKFYPRATGQVILAFDSTAREVTMRVGADSGVTTIDAAKRLAAAPVSAFGDFVHFTDLGASNMADELTPAVLAAAEQRGWCAGSQR